MTKSAYQAPERETLVERAGRACSNAANASAENWSTAKAAYALTAIACELQIARLDREAQAGLVPLLVHGSQPNE
jgi:hypothetical protein